MLSLQFTVAIIEFLLGVQNQTALSKTAFFDLKIFSVILCKSFAIYIYSAFIVFVDRAYSRKKGHGCNFSKKW